jgi:hypothetical protein
MQLKNPFSQEVKNNFLYVYWCFICQRSDKGIELHHITGRDNNSMINACPLCTECHQHIKHTKEEEHELREYSLIYYIGNKIEIPEKDIIYLKDIDYPLYKKYHSVLKLCGEHL